MQENLTVARPYALAAFRFSVDESEQSEWATMLESLASATAHPDLQPLITHPKIAKSQLKELLVEILGAELNAHRENFLGALIDAGRLSLAPEISVLFEQYKAAADGVVDVTVESAFEISETSQEQIATALRAKLGRQCRLVAAVNPDLIGGAVIKVGDSVIDISLRGRLQALQQQLS
ncbi:MAG: F-type H+-transporting ATPase subunit delta [Gammaproteobacteria bacterium]|jgi:F-type H+-transporting ATPase subunit delta